MLRKKLFLYKNLLRYFLLVLISYLFLELFFSNLIFNNLNKKVKKEGFILSKKINYSKKRCHFAIWTTYPPKICGVAEYSKSLIDLFLKNEYFLKNCSLEVFAIYKYNEYKKYVPLENNYPVHKIYLTNIEHSEALKESTNYINTQNFTHLIMHQEFTTTPMLSHPIIFLSQLNPFIKVFVFIHTPGLNATIKRYNTIKLISRLSHTLISLSWHGFYNLIDNYKVERNKVKFFPIGVNLCKNDIINRHFRLQGVDKNDFLLLTHGIISGDKGYEKMIKALWYLKKNNKLPKNIKFLIVGFENVIHSIDNILYLVKRYKLEKNFFWVNKYLPIRKMKEYIQRADIYVSLYTEHFSTSASLLDAIACGKAIISTSYKYATEILTNNTARIVSADDYKELANNIIYLYKNYSLRKKLSDNMYNFAKKIEWKNVGNNILDYILTDNYNPILNDPYSN